MKIARLVVACSATYIQPQPVSIPQLSTQGVLAVGKPILRKTGLIQVEMPVRQAAVPASVTAATTYSVSAPQKGRVIDQTEPAYFCKKEGYVMVEARFVCPTGFDIVGGECSRRAAFNQVCPPDYEMKDGTCAKLVTISSVYTCPDGTIEISEGVCERQTVEALSAVCTEGTYDGANCIVQSHVEARAFCPEGFTFFDGACIQEETYDCTHHAGFSQLKRDLKSTTTQDRSFTQPVTLPQINRTPYGLTRSTPMRKLHETASLIHDSLSIAVAEKNLAKAINKAQRPYIRTPLIQNQSLGTSASLAVNGACTGSATIANRAGCAEAAQAPAAVTKTLLQPTKTTVTVQKTCTKVTSTALVFACDEGVLQGQKCLIHTPVQPEMVCKHHGDHRNCHSKATVTPLSVCPADYQQECTNGKCQCVALEAAAFVQSCPSGFDSAGDGCMRSAQANIVCPPGFNLEGENCLRIIREPADCVFSVTYECDRAQGACV